MQTNRWLGALAGGLGGLLGGLVKMGCEGAVPPRPEGRAQPPWVLAKNIWRSWTGAELDPELEKPVTLAIHFGFSIGCGAGYGALAESVPQVTLGYGSAHGLANWVGAHELLLTALELTPPLAELPISEQINEAVSHAIWGVAVELVRRPMRGMRA